MVDRSVTSRLDPYADRNFSNRLDLSRARANPKASKEQVVPSIT